MSEIQIPPEARKALFEAWSNAITSHNLDPLDAAIRAALEAWPGMRHAVENTKRYTVIILPLPPEPRDE